MIDEALRALSAHRLRTALAILGVVGAVAAIVTSAGIVQGGRRSALAMVAALGERNVIVRGPSREGQSRAIEVSTVSISDVREIAARIPGVTAVASIRTAPADIRSETARLSGTLVGVSVNWSEVATPRLAAGRWFSSGDLSRRARVMVLGSAAASRLAANGASLVGQQVKAGDEWFVVVGVLEPRSQGVAAQRFDLDLAALIPITAATRRLGADDGADRAEEVVVRFATAEAVERSAAALSRNLRAIAAGSSGGSLEILVPREILRARLSARRSFDFMLLGTSAVALFISGLAIVNIMLVSVTERAPEIGLRRACGARKADILRQFTLEAALLTVAGAAGGTVVAVAIVSVLAVAGWEVSLGPSVLLLAWAIVLMTGIACGLYPARRAAALMPAEALRIA